MSVPFTYAAIDFETTGSVAGYPVEPWQVGVVMCQPGEEPVFWESYLRIGERPFHPRAPGRHAKIRQKLKQAPSLEECLKDLRRLCVGIPLLAHNCATEINCLKRSLAMERFGPWIDSLTLSRSAWPTLSSHKLEDLLSQLNLEQQIAEKFPDRQAHDALYDAYASSLLLEYLLKQPGWNKVSVDVLMNPDVQGYYRQKRN